MADLIGVQIAGLQTAPALASTTEFAVQRQAITKAEKVSLNTLLTWLLANNTYTANLSSAISSKITEHTVATDPHGDRAYSNAILTNHVNSAGDPHGDRAYTSNLVTSTLTNHIAATDPHADRAYALGLVNTHVTATDPHGDRAYATNAITNGINLANTYTDSKVNSEFTARLGTTVAPLISGKVPNNYLNLQVSFSNLANFPVTGRTDVLYFDAPNSDLYSWNGTTYNNITPPVDVSTLTLTTDNVAEGSSPSRKYLTAAKNTEFTEKLDNIASETSSNSTSLFSRKENKIGYIKNIKTEAPLTAYSTTTDVVLVDNSYKYSVNSSDTNSLLSYNTSLKPNLLANYDEEKIYEINGEVVAKSSKTDSGKRYLTSFDKFEVKATLLNKAIFDNIDPVVSASFSSNGMTINGVGIPNSSVSIYNKSYTQVSFSATNGSGAFSYTFPAAQSVGDWFYIYSTAFGGLSTPLKIYSPTLVTLPSLTNVSTTIDKSKVRGQASRLATVEVKDNLDVVIGTGTADENGFFDITVSPVVVTGNIIKLKSSNANGAVSDVLSHTVIGEIVEVPYNVLINNARTTASGKATAGSTVTLYDELGVILGTATATGGNFSIAIATPNTSVDSYKIEATVGSNHSTQNTVKVVPHYAINSEPQPVAGLISEDFTFMNKEIVRKEPGLTVDFDIDFDIQVNTSNSTIELKAINNSTKAVTWSADLKINVTDI